MNKALFVDVDNTLTTTISGKKFKENWEDIKVMEGVEKALKYYQKNWLIIGISNQGGIAAGHKTLREAFMEMGNTMKLLPSIKEIYISTDFEGLECWRIVYDAEKQLTHYKREEFENFRKPEPGMIKLASQSNNISIADSWMVGDRSEDKQAAKAAGINFIWADRWRARFCPGVNEFENATPEELAFLEGIPV